MKTSTTVHPFVVGVLMMAVAGCGPAPRRGATVGTGGTIAQLAQRPSGQATQPPFLRQVADTGRSDGGMMQGRGMAGRGGMMGGGMMGRPADTTAAPQTGAPACPDISPALVAAGRKIFSGQGSCFACHGMDAHGSAMAPNLADSTWLNIDGSYAAIADLVRSGVPHPKKFPAPMPPMGGAQLSADQICAVAAYVHGLGGGKS